jgi:beta-N-acetylhexosaminidase
MTAHLMVPALDAKKPVTFSRAAVTDLLKTRMKFKGVVITDALNMKALANTYSVEEIALNAFHAGHDILLYGDHIAPNIDDILRVQLPRAFAALKSVSEQELDVRVLKVLRLKEKFAGPVPSKTGVYEDLHTKDALELLKKL